MINTIDLIAGRVIMSSDATELFSISNKSVVFRQKLALNKVMITGEVYEKINKTLTVDLDLITIWKIDGNAIVTPPDTNSKWESLSTSYFGTQDSVTLGDIYDSVRHREWYPVKEVGSNGSPVIIPPGVLSFLIINDQAIGQGAAQDIEITVDTPAPTVFLIEKDIEQWSSNGFQPYINSAYEIQVKPLSTGTCRVYYSIGV